MRYQPFEGPPQVILDCKTAPFFKETSILFHWPGCIIELGVKYSGHNLLSQPGLSQAACATLCLTEAECSHWTYNPTRVKCWLKTSSQVALFTSNDNKLH